MKSPKYITILRGQIYTYDKAGNKLTIVSNEGLHQYAYDKTYQLIDVTYPDKRTGHYEYDAMGNRVYVDDRGEAMDYALKPNGLNQYDAVSKSTHNVDVKGTVKGTNPVVSVNNIKAKVSGTNYLAEDITLNSGANTITAKAASATSAVTATSNVTLDTAADKLFTYDLNGSLTRTTFTEKQVNYTYDYENRLISITQTGLPNVSYKYDYLGRRIEKNVGGTITKYIYDGDNIIVEYDTAGTLTAKYIYGPNIDEPIRMERLAPAAQVCYYHFDALGSVTDLSNSSGLQIEHYYYSPFGKTKIYDPATRMKRASSAYGNYYMFTARQWDSESNLYYYRARMYDPNLGRFLQTDPVGYDADVNLYRYCGNNSINRVDPNGLEGKKTKSKKTGKVGHVTIHSPIVITGTPTIIICFHSKKGEAAKGVVYAFNWGEFFKRLSPWNWADPTPFPWQEITDPDAVKDFMGIANELGKKNQQSRDLVGDDAYPNAPKKPYK